MHQGRCSATVIALAAFVSGCSVRPATQNTQQSSSRAPSTLVTAKELGQFSENGKLLEALERLRPHWFSSRGATPLTSVDGAPPTDLTVLLAIAIAEVREVRLERSVLSVGGASLSANGRAIRGDVIVVTTAAPGRRH